MCLHFGNMLICFIAVDKEILLSGTRVLSPFLSILARKWTSTSNWSENNKRLEVQMFHLKACWLHRFKLKGDTTSWNKLSVHTCTSDTDEVFFMTQGSYSNDSHFRLIIWMIAQRRISSLPLSSYSNHPQEALISRTVLPRCKLLDWCLPQAVQTGVNVIFSPLSFF